MPGEQGMGKVSVGVTWIVVASLILVCAGIGFMYNGPSNPAEKPATASPGAQK